VDVQGIKLIKTHLTKYVPSRNALINLDQFCQSLSTTSTTELAKSAIYVRQNIAKLIGDNDAAKKPSKSHQNSSAEESPTAMAAASGSVLNTQSLVVNFMNIRQPPQKFPPRKPSDSLIQWTVFGGQFRKLSADEDGDFELDLKKSFKVQQVNSINEQIRAVGLAKKKEEISQYKATGKITVRKKGLGPQLFQYKYYKDQQKVKLVKEDMDKVVDAVVDANSDPDNKETASKVLIKVLIDLYCANDKLAIKHTLSIFFEMLETNKVEVKLHAFNLLFNLSIHVTLYEESTPLQNPSIVDKVPISSKIHDIQEDLFSKLKEMLLWIYQKDEKK